MVDENRNIFNLIIVSINTQDLYQCKLPINNSSQVFTLLLTIIISVNKLILICYPIQFFHFFKKIPEPIKFPPNTQSYTNYNQPLNDVPNPEDKLCLEKGHHLLELLPAVMGVMFFLWNPVKVK